MDTLYIAVDISQASFAGAAWLAGKAQTLGTYTNDEAGFAAFAERVEQARQTSQATTVHLILEPTGGYELRLALYAYGASWLVSKPNPRQLRQWAQGMNFRTKTDQVDAKMLAEYGFRNQPAPQDLLASSVCELDYLLRRRQDLEKTLRMERNRLANAQAHPDMPKTVLRNLEQTIGLLETQHQEIEQAIEALVKGDASLRQQKRDLLSIPGVGPKNVLPLLVLLARFHALTQGKGTAKQLTAFLGLDVQFADSGTSVHKRPVISKQGDRTGRTLLYMGALGGVRGHNVLRTFYQLLVSRGKAKKLALVACARKILTWAWAVFGSNTPFDSSRFPHLSPLPT
jgi:transposase